MLGPPGSGRSTNATMIAAKFGLVNIDTNNLLKEEVGKKTDNGVKIKKVLSAGDLVPDEIIISLVEQRLKQSDCRVNGWVLDGFPKSQAQMTLLNALRMPPSHVVILDCVEDVSVQRLKNIKIDTQTGIAYDMSVNAPKDEAIKARLVKNDENEEETIRKR
jgi:adenylate kinase